MRWNMDKAYIRELVEKYKDFTIEAREHLHRYPELGNQEFKTIAYIKEILEEAAIEHYQIPGMTAIVGLM